MLKAPEQAARELRKRFGQTVPMDVFAMARACGITVIPAELDDDVSGVLIVQGDTATIGFNKDHPPTRQRFTVAHEICHWLLHKGTSKVFVDTTPVFFRDGQSSEGTALQEIQANQFAAELLMPEDVLRQRIDAHPHNIFDESDLRMIASEYGVSLQAMTIRLTALKLIKIE